MYQITHSNDLLYIPIHFKLRIESETFPAPTKRFSLTLSPYAGKQTETTP